MLKVAMMVTATMEEEEEFEREVEIIQVVMTEHDGGGWDAHVTLGTRNPSIELGTFVMPNVKSPEEFHARFIVEAQRFIEDEVINRRSYAIVH